MASMMSFHAEKCQYLESAHAASANYLLVLLFTVPDPQCILHICCLTGTVCIIAH